MNNKKEYIKKLEGKIGSQKGKLNCRLKKEDFDGAITASKTFLEGVFEHIHIILLGQRINGGSKLQDKYKIIKKLLKLDPNKENDEYLKAICGNISALISNIEEISNNSGDRHFTELIPKKYLASFVVKISLNLADFLYQRIKFLYGEYHPKRMNLIYERVIEILDSHKRGYSKELLLKDEEINYFLSSFERDPYPINLIINKFISDFEIQDYRKNDIFFAAMRLFSDYLDKDRIKAIFYKCKDNDQTWPPWGHLVDFLEEIKEIKPGFVTQEMIKFINDKKIENA